jgi:uncharacterized protein YdeI (YjbR/CyaY-like superfamily)
MKPEGHITMSSEFPDDHIVVRHRSEWRQWLEHNHLTSPGVWLVTYKKDSPEPSLGYAAGVEEALCFGWIDSKPGKVDKQRSKLYYSPRKKGSGWSKVNRIEEAKADGSWSKLDEAHALIIPPELDKALNDLPPAADNFAAFPASARRGALEWLALAKRAETRRQRIQKIVEAAYHNKRVP